MQKRNSHNNNNHYQNVWGKQGFDLGGIETPLHVAVSMNPILFSNITYKNIQCRRTLNSDVRFKHIIKFTFNCLSINHGAYNGTRFPGNI